MLAYPLGVSQQDSLPELVRKWTAGDSQAFDKVVEIVYDDLRAIAHNHLKQERHDHTLDTTALVHEAYLALAKRTGPEWQGPAQFFALVSKVMRHLLIDHARKRQTLKRSTPEIRVPLDEVAMGDAAEMVRLLALDQALDQLEEQDERMARIVECRYFGGMPHSEIAEALGISVRSVERSWSRARTYLLALLAPSDQPPETVP